MKRLFLLFLSIMSLPSIAAPTYQDYSPQGALNVLARDSKQEAALGYTPDMDLVVLESFNKDIDSASGYETVWPSGGTFTKASVSEICGVASATSSDSSAGIGARTLRIYGVSASSTDTEDITLSGTTSASTTKAWDAINKVEVLTAGSSLTNLGEITITQGTSSVVLATIPANYSLSKSSIYTLSDSQNAYIESVELKVASSTDTIARFQGVIYNASSSLERVVFEEIVDSSVDNEKVLNYPIDGVIRSNELFYIKADVDQDNSEVFTKTVLKVREL